jgi:hypothetical protein
MAATFTKTATLRARLIKAVDTAWTRLGTDTDGATYLSGETGILKAKVRSLPEKGLAQVKHINRVIEAFEAARDPDRRTGTDGSSYALPWKNLVRLTRETLGSDPAVFLRPATMEKVAKLIEAAN